MSMRIVAVLAIILAACASSTVPSSEACQEVHDSYCSAVTDCNGDGSACEVSAHQTCDGKQGETDATHLESCLILLKQYNCSVSRTPTPLYGSDAEACLAMY